jgi:hypothetical protein
MEIGLKYFKDDLGLGVQAEAATNCVTTAGDSWRSCCMRLRPWHEIRIDISRYFDT